MAQTRLLISQLNDLSAWWLSGLRDLAPVALIRRLHRERDRIIIHIDADTATVVHLDPKQADAEKTFRFPWQDSHDAEYQTTVTWLKSACGPRARPIAWLPDASIVSKIISLPAAAEENLYEVVGFEIDRQTPFKAENVYFDCAVVARDEVQQTLRVRLDIALREDVDRSLDPIKAWGIDPEEAIFGPHETPKAQIKLHSQSLRTARLTTAGNFVVAVVALLLLIAASTIPLYQAQKTLARLQEQIAQVRERATEVAQMRNELERADHGVGFLVKKRRQTPLAIESFDALSRLVPDDAWVNRLELSKGQITVQGEAKAATVMIEQLEASARFSEAKFTSSVRQNAQTAKEQFSLSATVVGSAPP